MAVNWNVKAFTNAVVNGGEEAKNAIHDAGRRFPLAVNAITTVLASANEMGKKAFLDFASGCPDFLTLRKIETVLKDGVADVEESANEVEPEVAEAEVETPKKEKKAKKEKAGKKEKPAKKGKKAKKAEPEDDDEDEEEPETSKKSEEDEDDDDDDWDL